MASLLFFHFGGLSRRTGAVPLRPESTEMGASLGGFRFGLFSLSPSGETLLLTSIVRTRLQFIVFARVAVEENDFLRVFGLRHVVWTSGIALAARAFWTHDAEAPASSDASASIYNREFR
jgi:hypothetical protein